MTTDGDSADIERRTLRKFKWLSRANPEVRQDFWEAGQQPPHRLYIAVDGFVTQSFPKPKSDYTPWRDRLAALIGEIDPGALVRGFSYLQAGLHYAPNDTTVSIDDSARLLAENCKPSAMLPTTYIAFSLGGVIAAVGLAQAIEADHGIVEALILVQPAFVLTPDLRKSDWYRDSNLFPIQQLAKSTTMIPSATGLLLADRILLDLASLTAQGIPIHLLYWPGDEFLSYGQPNTGKDLLTTQLQHFAGVSVGDPLEPTFPNQSHMPDSFRDHAYVASDPDTLDRLATLLRQVLQLA